MNVQSFGFTELGTDALEAIEGGNFWTDAAYGLGVAARAVTEYVIGFWEGLIP
jgi:hypothetical protein